VLGLTNVYNNAFSSDLALVFSFKYSHLFMSMGYVLLLLYKQGQLHDIEDG
jgi:hypothetical protein